MAVNQDIKDIRWEKQKRFFTNPHLNSGFMMTACTKLGEMSVNLICLSNQKYQKKKKKKKNQKQQQQNDH